MKPNLGLFFCIILTFVVAPLSSPSCSNYALYMGEFAAGSSLMAINATLPTYIMEVTRARMTSTSPNPHFPYAPMGQIGNADRLATPEDTYVKAPNNDTLYSYAWLNLSEHSYVLEIPDFGNRYYVESFINNYNFNFFNVSSKLFGSGPATVFIVSPQFEHTIAQGPVKLFDFYDNMEKDVYVVISPTDFMLILGRILVISDDDLPDARALQSSVHLKTLEQYSEDHNMSSHYLINDLIPDPLKHTTEYVFSTNLPNSIKYFDYAYNYSKNTPLGGHNNRLDGMKGVNGMYGLFTQTGLTTSGFNYNKLDPVQIGAIQAAMSSMIGCIQSFLDCTTVLNPTKGNCWHQFLDITHVDDFSYLELNSLSAPVPTELLRGADGIYKIGFLSNSEALYYYTLSLLNGTLLDGNLHKYVIHFDSLPPVDGCWSLTAYDNDFNLIENEIHRYSIGSRTQGLSTNPDGSVDIYIQSEMPEYINNWLPICKKQFSLFLRLYKPDQIVYDGYWPLPIVYIND